MADNTEKLEQFKNVTGTNDERARFYLDSASWNVEMALASFYDADHDDDNSDVEVIEDRSTGAAAAGGPPPSAQSPPIAKTAASKFATIHTINASSDEDEEEGQAFYAGGSEHSGQQVLGPKKKDFVQDMFKSVKEHGVEVLEGGKGGPSGKSRTFHGAGYKLGQTTNDTVEVPGAAAPPQPSHVTLKLWRDGFSVNNGELRLYTDPGNQDFLSSIRRGEIPAELRSGQSEVHVSMEDHRMEEFTRTGESSRSRHVFQGPGHTLGSPAPPTIGAPSADDSTINEAHAKETLKVDREQPITNIQIRLADGTRLVGEFNHTHTIAQVRNYIVSARPQYETRTFSLMSAYPPRPLDDAQTIAEAGLLNAAIIQKLT